MITAVLKNNVAVERAILFGSRAMGNYKKGSDVDIALVIKNNDANVILDIQHKLNEETTMPYFFDVLNYGALENQELVEHIITYGKTIY